jgi:hypothetical protein
VAPHLGRTQGASSSKLFIGDVVVHAGALTPVMIAAVQNLASAKHAAERRGKL